MNILDSVIASISPQTALKRVQARQVLAAYEAAKPNKLRKQSRDTGSGNRWVQQAGNNLRNQARYLDANHDLARGILTALVNNVAGANGIGIEPQPRSISGEIDEPMADSLLRLFKDWCKKPECSHRLSWSQVQRLMCRSWLRDGEAFAKDLVGDVLYLDHGTQVKYSLELLESDMIPLIYDDSAKNIVQGIECNGWGKPKAYHVYRNHPGEINVYTGLALQLLPIDAQYINHLALRDRISQRRGVSVFASVMTRLDDVKDYEESERIAAKIAASMTAYIKRSAPEMYPEGVHFSPDDPARQLKFQPGMIFDDLGIGEDIGLFDSNRPNTNLVGYRTGQLRAIAAGTAANYSTISRDYDGSYSSQRQELVEGWTNYQVLQDEFISAFVQPVWERFVAMAIIGGLIKVPLDIDPLSINDALFIPPSMPWIDPKKESDANVAAERAGYLSGPEIIRRRGNNPHEVLEQEVRWRKKMTEKGLISSADPANDTQPQTAQTAVDNTDAAPAAHRKR